jgi:O-antigen/teichoic acid export membrane protein
MDNAMPQATEAPSPANQGHRLITNVLWSWTGVAASLFQGIVIARFLLKSLGEEHYGIWALIFSILDYFWFFDLGLNSAVTNFCARFLAMKEPEKINQVISTSLFYFSIIAVVVWSVAPVLAWNAHRFFRISPANQHEFSVLILITGISWGLCIMLHMFLSALDGFQRFDLTSRVMVTQVALRCAGYFFALKTGHGLVMMAEIYVGTQILGYILNFLNFRRVFPQLQVSRDRIRWSMFRDIFRYGLKSFVANSSGLVLNQSGPVMVGHYLGEGAVGFYTLPAKLLQQAYDAVSRIGMVTRSNAAELSATAKREAQVSLGMYSNRYSLTLFLPLACYLWVYGRDVIGRWMGPVMAQNAAPLLPIFLVSYSLVLAAQFNSSSLLFGVGRHGGYARALVVEAAAYLGSLIWVVPRYGIWGAAWATAGLMILVRGLYTPWLVSQALECSFTRYMAGIYIRPLLTAIPAIVLAFGLKRTILPGRSWPELIAAAALTAGIYMAVAMFACIAPHHRALFVGRIPLLGRHLVPKSA